MRLFQILVLLCISFYTSHAIEWQEVNVPKSEYVNRFIQKGEDIIISSSGLRVSHDSGKTFDYSNKLDNFFIDSLAIQNNIFQATKLYITNNGNYLVFYSNQSAILSQDEGESWQSINISLYNDYGDIFETNKGLYLVNAKDIYFSEDDGLSWEKVFTSQSIYSIINAFLKDNKIFVLYPDTENHVSIFETYSLESDSTEYFEIDTKYEDVYLYDDTFYAFIFKPSVFHSSIDTLWASTNNGADWNLDIDMKEQISNQLGTNKENTSLFLLAASDGIIAVQVLNTSADSDGEFIAISFDNGYNWNKIESSYDEEFQVYFQNRIQNGIFYSNLNGWKRYDKESNSMVDMGFVFPLIQCYRKYSDQELAVTYSVPYKEEWLKTGSEWEFKKIVGEVQDRDDFFYTMKGEFYEINKNNLLRTFEGKTDTIAINQDRLDIVRTFNDGSILLRLDAEDDTYSSDLALVEDGIKDIVVKDADYYIDYDKSTGTYYSVIWAYGKKPMTYVGTKTSGIIDSLELDILSDSYYVYDFAAQGSLISLSTASSIYTSIDGGKTLSAFTYDRYFRSENSTQIINNAFYAGGALGLFRSYDGQTWENITEDKFEGNVGVVKYEFDLEGYIYIYTTMGTFKSTDPVSVKEEDQNVNTPNISINIYPNPSSDILNFDFNGHVEKTAVIDLNGNIISCPQTLNSLDVSELSSGAYFLKVTSNGKTYYRQFVKAE